VIHADDVCDEFKPRGGTHEKGPGP
jgi:hypothetical protein